MKYILYLIIVLVVGVIFFTLTVFGVRTLYKRTMTKQAAKNYQKYLDNSEMENGKRFLSRDSLLVVYYMTSLEKHSIGKEWQNSSPMIQDIFYSPDSLKMIAFGILKDIDKEGISIPNNRIRVFAGIRKSKREIWKVHRITNLAEDTEMQEEAHLKTGDVTRKLKYKYFTYNIRKSSVKVYNDKLKFAGKVRKKQMITELYPTNIVFPILDFGMT